MEELWAEESSHTEAGDKCEEDRATERYCCVVTQPSGRWEEELRRRRVEMGGCINFCLRFLLC